MMDIREHMEIVDVDGTHIGTVDRVEGDRIKMTKKDSRDGQHHFLDTKQVAGVDGGRVKLNQKASALKLQVS
jgi:hypothetical protein